jgi:CheY-like chemotaxis protein
MSIQLNCILLIDDDEPTNFLHRITLQQAGCARHIRVAQSGQEALDYLVACGSRTRGSRTRAKSEGAAGPTEEGTTGPTEAAEDFPRPDLIFLDINMPAMDGWEFLERYRLLPPERKTGIVLIMLTTSLNPDDEVRTRAIPEVAGFENKPLGQEQLDALLNKYFDGR